MRRVSRVTSPAPLSVTHAVMSAMHTSEDYRIGEMEYRYRVDSTGKEFQAMESGITHVVFTGGGSRCYFWNVQDAENFQRYLQGYGRVTTLETVSQL